jgi:hypothetical protein
MGLKKLYYKLEDKYYDFVERTGLYKLTDKIDRVMPSFVLFILLILIIIAGVLLLIFSGARTYDSVDIQFKVIDADSGIILEDVSLVVYTTQDIFTVNTLSDGLTEKIKVPKETKYQVEINNESYERFSEYYDSTDVSETITIALEPKEDVPVTVSYNFSVVDSKTNQVINKNGNASFKCLNGVLAPSPMSLSSGQVTVNASPECVLVIESISFSGYITGFNIPITNNTLTIPLNPQEIEFSGDKVDVVFNVKNSIGDLLSNIKITITNNLGVVATGITSTDGTYTFEDLEKGEYTVNFTDMRAVPIYTTQTQTYYLSDDSTRTVTLSTDVQGYIYVKIVGQNNLSLEDAEVSLKTSENNTIEAKFSDVNGLVIFTVPEIKDYNVVVDAEGYLIERKLIKATDTMPTNPTIIKPILITPGTLAKLNVRVLNWDSKGFKFAKVVLFDADTGFLTDYKPQVTNYDGNAIFNIASGKYIAKAIKGSSEGTSQEFDFSVKFPDNTGTVTIPMNIVEGTLRVFVVDKDNQPFANARVDLYDRYSYYSNFPAIPIKSELTDSQGFIEFKLDAENDYYVVASDHLSDFYGKTQSRFIRVSPDVSSDLKVILYPKNSSTSKPRMIFTGIYKDGKEIKDNLKAGEDYRIRYNLLVPQNRTGSDRFEEIGFMLRTGSTSMIENDSLFIKELDVPYLDSVLKYTQFNINPPHESEGFKDSDSLTEGNFKWAKATLQEGPINYQGALGFYNAYEIEALISVKDIAVFGEELKMYNLGYALTEDDVYETSSTYLGSNQLIEYYDVYDHITYGVGDELFCSTEFCFSSNIIDLSDDLRYDVSENFAVMPNKDYKYTFTLINNSLETKYLSSRFILENLDEGLDFKNIRIVKPNGEVYTRNNPSEFSFDIPITQLEPKQKVTGEIIFRPKLKGTRNLSIRFISDQRIRYTNQLFLEVSSDKEFNVTVDPKIIPAGKNFNLIVNAKDSVSNLPVKDTTVTIKDRFKDVIRDNVLIPSSTGEVMISNIPAQAANESIYVYVTSPGYQTNITEMKTTDKLFNIVPRNLAYSLNIFNEKQKTESFTINNISPLDLTIESLVVKGDGLEIVDLHRINNDLLNSVGIVIKGLDTTSDFPDNTDASKQIPLTISLNPRADAIREIQNLSSTLKIVLASGDNKWVSEIPIRVNVGFDGLLDNPNCLTLTNSLWKEVSLDKPVETSFVINNTCTINNTKMPLSNGIEARVLFDSNPQGKFILSIDNRFVELTHGNFRRLIDTVDRDRSYPVILRYEPVGRMKGTVKGKIQFRSLNSTGTGNQEIISEIEFEIDVTNLKDCVVFSKTLLNVGQMQDSFTIENKGCPVDMTYRVSCDDCPGLIVEPRREVTVSKTGVSEEIIVRSMGAMPGAYVLNIFGDMDSRQSERAIKKIKVYVRPTDYCLDLERYEFDLYRGEYSESTGGLLSASSYDVTNIINLCYAQDVDVKFTVKEDARWKMAGTAFLRDGLLTTGVSGIIQSLLDPTTSLWGVFSGNKGDKSARALQESVDKSSALLASVSDLSAEDQKKLTSRTTALNNAIATGDKAQIDNAYNALENEIRQVNASGENKTEENNPPGNSESQSTYNIEDYKMTKINTDATSFDINGKTYFEADYTPESWTQTIPEINSRITFLNQDIDVINLLEDLNVNKINQSKHKVKEWILEIEVLINSYLIKKNLSSDLKYNVEDYKMTKINTDDSNFDINGETYLKDNYTPESWTQTINQINKLIDLYLEDLNLKIINNNDKSVSEKKSASETMRNALYTEINKKINDLKLIDPEVGTQESYLDLDSFNNSNYNGNSDSVSIINATINTLNNNKLNFYSGKNFTQISALSNDEICNLNDCITYNINDLTDQKIGSLIGVKSQNVSNIISYVAIYLGEEDGVKKIFRISGSQQKYIVEPLESFITAGYSPIKIIEPKNT